MDPAPVIVGREAELERLDGVLDALAEDDRGEILELVGEPGIGKTCLATELCRRAEDRGYLVLSGLAAEFEQDLPFGLIVDALDSYLAAAQGREIERLGGPSTGELATVFPSLREYTEEGAPRLQDERHRAHRAIRNLLEGLAGTRPMVLALDDLHWADEASLEVVATLMRRPPDAPVLVTLAFRTAQEPEIVAATARVAQQGGWLERVELGPLAADAAAAVLGEDLEPTRSTELVGECGGNPFYLTELARFEADSGNGRPTPRTRAPAGALDDPEVPGAVSAAIAHELRDLGEQATLFLRAAAVAGEPFEPDLAAEIAELTDAEALEVLDRMLARGVVRPTDVPRRFLFRHPLVRRAVYESAPHGWRIAAHRRATDALTQRGAGKAERALHLEHAASVGDTEAVELFIEAAADASARAPASAARWLEAALRLLPEQGPLAERRLELLISLATSLAATGRLQESVDVIAELLGILPEDAVLPRVRLVAACARLKHLLGNHLEAREGLLRHADSVPEGSPEAANLQIELAVDAFYAMEFSEMRKWGERALASSTPLDEPLLIATAAAILAYGETLVGEVAKAESHRREAAAIVDAASDDELVMRLDALSHLGWTNFHLGHFDEAFWHLERGLTISRATGQVALLMYLRQGRAAVLASWGQLAEARETSEEMAESARLASNLQALSYSLAAVCWWAALAGQLDDARAAGEESLELAERLDENTLTVFAGAAVSEMHLQSGEYAEASELLRRTCGGEELTSVPRAWKPIYFEMLARAEAGIGRTDGASKAAAAAREAAGALGLEVQVANAERAQAVALLAAGDAAAAAESAVAAAEADEAVGAKIEAGRSRLLAGQAFIAAGDRERGIAELRDAETVLVDCGAERMSGQARRELRRLGKRTRTARSRSATGSEGLASLTGREREIAELVTARRTNREIAEELVLSEKTIESHMRNVFAKLGVSSRVDVARAVERENPA